MTTRRPRTVLAVSILILAAVLALFAIALARANRDDRRDAEGRFGDRAVVTAALTESLFASTAFSMSAELAEELGAPTLDRRALAQRAEDANVLFALVLDAARGNVIAATGDAGPGQVQAVVRDPAVRRTLAGAEYSLSDYLEGSGNGDTLLYSLSYKGRAGKRVYVSGFRVRVLADVLGAYLARIPGARAASAYVLDSQGRVIASPVRDQRPGGKVNDARLLEALRSNAEQGEYEAAGGQRAFAAAPVANSSWRVVLSEPTSELYAGIDATLEWLILIALAIAGSAAVALLARASSAAAQAQAASARLALANAELAQSNAELQRSNAELEQFAFVASHDLQEPLRKVQTFGDQLERRFGEAIPEDGIDYLRRMRAAAGRMSILIDDLLRFSRVTTRALPPEPVDLTRVAQEVTSDLEAVLDETQGSVEVGELPVVQADPLQMRQLMQNLIGNAIKFHRPGVPPLVRVRAVAPPRRDTTSFEVVDNGIGIEPEYRERIFRVFERLHPRDVYPGTGIGLALCRKIVERHGGTIDVEGASNGGSRFVVVLPSARSPGSAGAGPEHQHVPLNA